MEVTVGVSQSPLVSVVVITYNSAFTVEETLDSILNQTYPNIDLVITDDCSKDETFSVCKSWIEKHQYRFASISLISSPNNRGVSANCNNGLLYAKGLWIKFIAGDDALYPSALHDFMNFVMKYPSARIVHSRIDSYRGDFVPNAIDNTRRIVYHDAFIKNNDLDSKFQYHLLCLYNRIAAPSVFVSHDLLNEMDGFDERIPMCEDWPMWLKITHQGIPFYFLDKVTAKYRLSSTSAYGKETIDYLFPKYYKVESLIYKFYIKRYASLLIRWMNRYYYYIRLCLDVIKLNQKKCFAIFIFNILRFPYWAVGKLLKLF